MERCVELEKIISPVTLPYFEDTYFEKKPLLISRNNESHFRELLSINSIESYLKRKDIRYPSIRLVKNGLELPQTDYLKNIPCGKNTFDRLLDNDSFYNLFNEGATAVFQGMHRTLSSLGSFCQGIEKYYNFPLQTNIYLTPKSSQGFSAHYDDHDVFIIQTHGTKIWKVYDSPIHLPTKPFEKSIFTSKIPQIEIELKEGDSLYIPRGFIHEAVTTEDISLHITVGLLSYKWSDVIQFLVNDYHKIEGFRESFRFNRLDVDFIKKNTEDLVNQLLASADFANIKNAFKTRFIKKGLTSDNNRFSDLLKSDKITLSTVLSLRKEINFAISETSTEAILSFYNKQIKFPKYVMPTLTAMTTSLHFAIQDLKGNLDNPGKLVLCKKLLKEGFLSILEND